MLFKTYRHLLESKLYKSGLADELWLNLILLHDLLDSFIRHYKPEFTNLNIGCHIMTHQYLLP